VAVTNDTLRFWDAWDAVQAHDIDALHSVIGRFDIDTIHGQFPMTLLHAACAVDNFPAVKIIVEHGARFIPDGQGRMPSIIAVECEASEELCDYIVEQEEAAMEREESQLALENH
jgi:hypothetical protein